MKKNQSVFQCLRFALLLPAFFILSCSGSSTINKNPRNPYGAGPAPIPLSPNGSVVDPADLGAAGNYVILAKTGISNVTGSMLIGNIAVSPAASTYITGFSLTADATNVFSTSASVTGKVYAATYAAPTPTNLTSAIGNMETAYTTAAGRTTPDFNELSSGNLGSLTLAPGLYTWSTSVTIPLDMTISGGANDVWIFQVAGNINMAANKSIILAGGAQAKNIFWQVAGQVNILAGAHFEGIILCKTAVTLGTMASMNGRIYAQSMVALDNNAVTKP